MPASVSLGGSNVASRESQVEVAISVAGNRESRGLCASLRGTKAFTPSRISTVVMEPRRA